MHKEKHRNKWVRSLEMQKVHTRPKRVKNDIFPQYFRIHTKILSILADRIQQHKKDDQVGFILGI